MTEQEYNAKLAEIEAAANRQKASLMYEYARSQAIFKVGDIIQDHNKTILVQKISAYKSFGVVSPTYEGVILKKDLTPKKSGERGVVYGNKGVTLIK